MGNGFKGDEHRMCEKSRHGDHVHVMLMQEFTTYSSTYDYLSNELKTNDDTGNRTNQISHVWRQKICEWSYDIADHFGFDREAVTISMNYMDRFLSRRLAEGDREDESESRWDTSSNDTYGSESIDIRYFQLLAMTCLYLAIKIHGQNDMYEGGSYMTMKMSDFVALSRGLFTMQNMVDMEVEVLSTLNWRLNPPTLISFVTNFLHFLNLEEYTQSYSLFTNDFKESSSTKRSIIRGNGLKKNIQVPFHHIKYAVYELARYLTELSVSIYSLIAKKRSSCISFAAILIAIDVVDEESVPSFTRTFFLKNIMGASCMLDDEWIMEMHSAQTIMLDSFQDILSSSNPVLEKIISSISHCGGKGTISDSACDQSGKSSPRAVSQLIANEGS